MAEIAATVGTAVISTILEKLVSFAMDQTRGNKFLDELRSLQRKLNLVRELLDDAEAKQIQSPAIRDWLSDLKDAAYDAEDVLDEYATCVAVLRRKKGRFRKWIKKKVNQLGLTYKIKSINGRFDSLSNGINSLGLQKLEMPNRGNSISAQGRQSTSLLDVDWPIIGRDDVKDEIIKQLISNEVENNTTKLPVLPIVGMGGVGKTSLAQLVFNDSGVKEHFPLTIWVFVSQDFDPCKILRSIIETIYAKSEKGKPCELTSLESLHIETKKLIEKGKFLLILDDVWNEEQCPWEQLLTPLKFGENGSMVMVTTRSETVAKSIDGHMNPVNLESMDDNCIWEILKRCAVKGVADIVDDEEIKDRGMQIVKKLKGSPLAAKTIGRLLGTNPDKHYWKMILESHLWDVRGQNEHDIMPSLLLSYQYLPPKLKFCFSLCSLFPKGHRIRKENLTYIWIAHGIFPLEHKMTPENSAAEAIQALVSMSLLSQGMDDGIVFMHDLIHDVSKFVSREDHLYIKDKIIPEEHPPKLRHLSFSDMNWKSFSERNWEFKLPCDKLRSVLCTNERLRTDGYWLNLGDNLNGWLSQSKWLRVLDLHGYPVEVLPNSIGRQKHLRYLNLSNTGVSELPKSLTSLYNLQALWLEDCRNLKKLPEGMGNLVNLRLLKAPESLLTAIEGIGRLSNLQNLRFFDVDPKNGWGIEELENLGTFRGELTIRFLENVVDIDKARKASLHQKEYMEGLTLEWSKDCVVSSEAAEKVLEALHPNGDALKRLKIIDFGGRVPPSWLTTGYHFPRLMKLELVNWENCADFGPIIRNLNNFESLKLLSGGNLECSGKSSLRKVRIEDGQTLLSLHLPTSVEELYIDGYLAKDESLMTSLRGMTSLRSLSLVNSPNLSEVLEKGVVISLLERSLQQSARKGGNPGFHVCFGKISDSYWELKIQSFEVHWPSSDVKVQSRSGRWVWELLQHITSHLGRHIRNLKFGFFEGKIVEDGELEELFVPLTNLSKLEFDHCYQMGTLPTSINGLSSLRELSLRKSLTSLPSDMARLTSLQMLWLHKCPKIESLADIGLPASLQRFDIDDCKSLTSLPSDMRFLTSLQKLWLWRCPKIESLAYIGLPASLQHLVIDDCNSLTSPPSDMTRLTSLQRLRLRECPKIESLADIGLPASLQHLVIDDCNSLTSPPSDMTRLTSLQWLQLRKCPKIESLADIGLPASLQHLVIDDCNSLTSPPSDMTRLTSLQMLWLWRCPKIESLADIGLPASLQHLHIRGCESLASLPSNMNRLSSLYIDDCVSLTSLPSDMTRLTSLQMLKLVRCSRLQSFPKCGLPPSLSKLEIYDCPALKRKYRKGPERALIAHIPEVDWEY